MPAQTSSPTPIFRRVQTQAGAFATRRMQARVQRAQKAAKAVAPVRTGRFRRSIRIFSRPARENRLWRAWIVEATVSYAKYVLPRHPQIRRAVRRVLG